MIKRWFVLMLALCLLLTSTSVAFMEEADSETLPAEAIEEALLDSADVAEGDEAPVEEVEDDFGLTEDTYAPEAVEDAQIVEESDAAADAVIAEEPVSAADNAPVAETVVAESADEAAKAEAAVLAEAAPAGSKPAKVAFTLNGAAVSGTITVNKGESVTLVPVATTAAGLQITDIGFKWKSSKKKIATCAGGVIKAKKTGTTKVTVTTKRGKKKASIKIKVIDPYKATKVTLNETGLIYLFKGTKLQLTATMEPSYTTSTIKWTSSNKKVATVTKNGLVTGRKKGKAIITCKTSSGKKARVTVKVIKKGGPAKSLIPEWSPDAENHFVYRGAVDTYVVSTNPFNSNANMVWTSDNPNVINVIQYARSGDLSFWCDVQGVNLGTATLTCTDTVTGLTASVAVTVKDPPPPESITLPMGGIVNVAVGGKIDIPYVVNPSTSLNSDYNRATLAYDTNIADIGYDSNNADRNCLGTMDYNLHVTGKAPGSCTVTITLRNGVTASFTLVVG